MFGLNELKISKVTGGEQNPPPQVNRKFFGPCGIGLIMNTQNHAVIQPSLTRGARQKGFDTTIAEAAHSNSRQAFIAGITSFTLITSEIISFCACDLPLAIWKTPLKASLFPCISVP